MSSINCISIIVLVYTLIVCVLILFHSEVFQVSSNNDETMQTYNGETHPSTSFCHYFHVLGMAYWALIIHSEELPVIL